MQDNKFFNMNLL